MLIFQIILKLLFRKTNLFMASVQLKRTSPNKTYGLRSRTSQWPCSCIEGHTDHSAVPFERTHEVLEGAGANSRTPILTDVFTSVVKGICV